MNIVRTGNRRYIFTKNGLYVIKIIQILHIAAEWGPVLFKFHCLKVQTVNLAAAFRTVLLRPGAVIQPLPGYTEAVCHKSLLTHKPPCSGSVLPVYFPVHSGIVDVICHVLALSRRRTD